MDKYRCTWLFLFELRNLIPIILLMIQKYSSVIIFSILMVHFRIKSNQNLQESYSFIEALVCHFRQIVN